MALGRAYIEVHADLKPFQKDLKTKIGPMLRDVQKEIDKSLKDAFDKGFGGSTGGKGGGVGPTIRPKIKPEVDTKDSDKEIRGFFGRFQAYSKKAWGGFMDGLTFAMKNSDSIETAALILAGTIAAIVSPLIGAAIGAAVTAGLGSAGLAAGIALAFQDARIRTAATNMWDGIISNLERRASVFVGPLLNAFETLSRGIGMEMFRYERIFARLAPYVEKLADGIVGFIQAMGPGLEAAFANSGPVLETFANYLPILGESFGIFLERVSESPGVIAGMVAIMQIAGDALVYVGNTIKFLSDMFVWFLQKVDAMPDWLVPNGLAADVDEMLEAMLLSEEPMAKYGEGLNKISDASGNADAKTQSLTASLNAFFGVMLASSNAAIAAEQALDGVRDALKENGRNLDINTAKGRANVAAVNQHIAASIAARDAKIKETGSVSDGNRVYSTYIERLRKTLTQAGLTKKQIEELIGQYDELPPAVTTDVNAPGLSAALAQAARLNAELDRINRRAKTNPMGRGGDYTGVGGYAEGGVVRRQELAWVGEGNKPEAIVPLTNPKRAAEVMNEAGLTGFGGGTITVQLVLDGRVIEEKVVEVNESQARQFRHQPRRVI